MSVVVVVGTLGSLHFGQVILLGKVPFKPHVTLKFSSTPLTLSKSNGYLVHSTFLLYFGTFFYG